MRGPSLAGWCWGGLAVALLLVAMYVGPRLSNRTFGEQWGSIHSGLTRDEVDARMGCRAGDYGGGLSYSILPIRLHPPNCTVERWAGTDLAVDVVFDSSDRVVRCDRREVAPKGGYKYY